MSDEKENKGIANEMKNANVSTNIIGIVIQGIGS
jgi:hypothetical protein